MRYGINIPGDGFTPIEDVAATGCTLARLVAYPHYDATRYLRQLAERGIQPLVILASESFASDPASALTYYRRLYGDVPGIAWQVGNESDHASVSSWTQSHAQVNDLLRLARRTFGDHAYLVAPGLVSGNPEWVDGLDLSAVNACAVHPYGQRASRGWPHPEWGFGDVLDLVARYRERVGNTPLWVTEFGLSSRDHDEAFRADYLARMYATLAASAQVEVACWFALHDFDGFGLIKAAGERMPGFDALQGVTGVQTDTIAEPVTQPFEFFEGFGRWKALEPDLLGEPLENESGPIEGISAQRLTNGMLFWADVPAGVGSLVFIASDGRRRVWREDWPASKEAA